MRNTEEEKTLTALSPQPQLCPAPLNTSPFSVHEPINLFRVGFLSLEVERTSAKTQGHCKNVRKRPWKNKPRDGENRGRKDKWIEQAAGEVGRERSSESGPSDLWLALPSTCDETLGDTKTVLVAFPSQGHTPRIINL